MSSQNTSFTEFHHAFISGAFYKHLVNVEAFDGRAIFVLATQRYGEQRGSRMAQRALRDGRALDFATYNAYGEWSYTQDYYLAWKHVEILSKSPDFHYHVHTCPWHDQYASMGLLEGATLYCSHLDISLARGFNPSLNFEVASILHTGDRCDFILHGADLEKKEYHVDPKTTKMPFSYHCGHIFTTFSRVVESIMGEKGAILNNDVLRSFSSEYGQNMAEVLLTFRSLDFDHLPQEHRNVHAITV